MKPFPQLTVDDQADIVDRVFEKKVRDYIDFVRDSKTFGTVVGELHGLCGFANPTAACMKDGGACNRNFPKPYCNKTYIDKEVFVHYRRRDTKTQVQRQHVWLDNRSVGLMSAMLTEFALTNGNFPLPIGMIFGSLASVIRL
nr:DNA helicase [Tanacetum cinerariifolium]